MKHRCGDAALVGLVQATGASSRLHRDEERRGEHDETHRVGLGVAGGPSAVVFDDAEPVGRSFRVPCTKVGMDELERRATGAEDPCEVIMEPTGLAWHHARGHAGD